MSDADEKDDWLHALTPDERRVVASVLPRIERRLYEATIRRLYRTVLLITGIVALMFGGAGWVSWATVRDDLVENAVAGFSADRALRDEVVAELAIDTALIDAEFRDALAAIDSINEETARAAALIRPQLGEILEMLDQLQRDMGASGVVPR